MPQLRLRAAGRVLPALIVTAAILASALTASPAVAADRRIVVPGARPAWATASADLGAADSTAQVTVEIGLDLQDEAGAEALATAVSTPGDPQYRQGLAPADWIARFAPTQAQVDALTASLNASGLTVVTVPASRLFVLATGSVASMNTYFATRLHAYRVSGVTRYAATSSISLPGTVGHRVGEVAFSHATMASRAVKATASSAKTPCSAYWKQHTVKITKAYGSTTAGTVLCGYTAKQVRELYGLEGAASNGTALDGSGQTIAVIDAFGSPTMAADLATYSAKNGLPSADYTESVPASSTWDTDSCGDASGWAIEQSLDLEAIHAVAPRAKLVYVGASDCGTGFDVAMSQVLDNGLASIVSSSWGGTGLDTAAAEGDTSDGDGIFINLHQHIQAAGEGIGLYFASGDDGDDAAVFGTAATDFPASSPWVTAVGGTASGLDKHGRFLFSTAWGEDLATASKGHWHPALPGSFIGGAGGGLSSLFTAPWYQDGVVPTSLSGGARAESDVAGLAASTTGFSVGLTTKGHYTTVAVGGTSLATPIVAAEVALGQQIAGRSFGFLNPALYAVAAQGKTRDVGTSTVRRFVAASTKQGRVLVTIDRDSSLAVRRGYDLPTGVGELTLTSLQALAAD